MPQLSSETKVSIALLCQLCLSRYRAVQVNNCSNSTSIIKVATMIRIYRQFLLSNRSHNVQLPNQLSTKMNGTQRRTLISPEEYITRTAVCQKAPLLLKRRRTVTNKKPVALAVVELHWSEGIR